MCSRDSVLQVTFNPGDYKKTEFLHDPDETRDMYAKHLTGREVPSTATMYGCANHDSSADLSTTVSKANTYSVGLTGRKADEATCLDKDLASSEHAASHEEDEESTITSNGELLKRSTSPLTCTEPNRDRLLDHSTPLTDICQFDEAVEDSHRSPSEPRNDSVHENVLTLQHDGKPRASAAGANLDHDTAELNVRASSTEGAENSIEPPGHSLSEKGDMETARDNSQYKMCMVNGGELVSMSIDEDKASHEENKRDKRFMAANGKDEMREVAPSSHQDDLNTNSSTATHDVDSGYAGSPLLEKDQVGTNGPATHRLCSIAKPDESGQACSSGSPNAVNKADGCCTGQMQTGAHKVVPLSTSDEKIENPASLSRHTNMAGAGSSASKEAIESSSPVSLEGVRVLAHIGNVGMSFSPNIDSDLATDDIRTTESSVIGKHDATFLSTLGDHTATAQNSSSERKHAGDQSRNGISDGLQQATRSIVAEQGGKMIPCAIPTENSEQRAHQHDSHVHQHHEHISSLGDGISESHGHVVQHLTAIEGRLPQTLAKDSASQPPGLGISISCPPTTCEGGAPAPIDKGPTRFFHAESEPRDVPTSLQAPQSQTPSSIYPSPSSRPPHSRPQTYQQHVFQNGTNQAIISNANHFQRQHHSTHNYGRFGDLDRDFELRNRIARLDAENRKLRNDRESERRVNRDLRITVEEEHARATNEALDSMIMSLFHEKQGIAKRSAKVAIAEAQLQMREAKVYQQEVFLAVGQKTLNSLLVPGSDTTLKSAEIALLRAQVEAELTARHASLDAILRARVAEFDIRESNVKHVEKNFDLHCREKLTRELESEMQTKLEYQTRQKIEGAYWEGFKDGREERHAAEMERIRQQAFEEGMKADGMEREARLGVLVPGIETEKFAHEGRQKEANLMDL